MAKGQDRRAVDRPEPADGRELRGRRNREKILQAVYELVRENQAAPTAEQVAARAKVGERTVFRHFADLETLDADMRARVQSEVTPLLLKEIPVDGALGARVDALVAKRSAIFEHLAPFRRAGRTVSALSEDEGPAQLARFLRAEITRVFAKELNGAAPEVLEATDLTASFEAWERLRRDQRLGCERAKKVVIAAVTAVFAKK